jgi:nucleotide-binding universal stress UspA family protein
VAPRDGELIDEAFDVGNVEQRCGDAGDHRVDGVDRADEWDADLIVVGRSDLRRPGQPYVASQTEHVLEFTRLPVVVVPDV